LFCSSAKEEAALDDVSRKVNKQPEAEQPEAVVEERDASEQENGAGEATAPSAAAQDNEADDAVHAAAADLFRMWLAEHKAQIAREEEVRLSATPAFCCTYSSTVQRKLKRHEAVGSISSCPVDASK